MASHVYVYDPTSSDELSRVRGVGRYLQILRENFADEFTFTSDLTEVPTSATLINPFINFVKSPIVKKRLAKKQIGVIHDLIPLKYPEHFPLGIKGKFNVWQNKQLLKNYDRIITDSEHSKKDIIQILDIPDKKISVIYPILPKIFRSKPTKNTIKIFPIEPVVDYFIYVGDVTWNKNLLNLARAVKQANVTIVCVGRAFTRKPSMNIEEVAFSEFMSEVQGDKRFVFPGFVSDEDLISLYRGAVANILISHDEGFGFSYLEAASCACPSILADSPIFRETAADTALFAVPSDSNDIASKISLLLGDQVLQKKIGSAAQRRSKEFSSITFKKDFSKAISS